MGQSIRQRLLVIIATLTLAACAREPASPAGGAPAELEITVLRSGDGVAAAAGQNLRVHYTGWLYDEREPGRKGAQFDSSRPRGEAFVFQLGQGRVIRGWDEGVAGMRVGEIRELAIPADLAYGSRGAGRLILPHQPLLFEVELLAIESAL